MITEIIIIDRYGIDIFRNPQWERANNIDVKNMLNIEYGNNSLKKSIILKLESSDFKNRYSWFITRIECRTTKYSVNPIINGKRKKVKWIRAIKNNSEESRLLLIWFLMKK